VNQGKSNRNPALWRDGIRLDCGSWGHESWGGYYALRPPLHFIQALGKNILEIVKAFIFVNLLFHIFFSILFDTEVTACQVLTIGITETVNKAFKEFIN
jgi:hypothetical protein